MTCLDNSCQAYRKKFRWNNHHGGHCRLRYRLPAVATTTTITATSRRIFNSNRTHLRFNRSEEESFPSSSSFEDSNEGTGGGFIVPPDENPVLPAVFPLVAVLLAAAVAVDMAIGVVVEVERRKEGAVANEEEKTRLAASAIRVSEEWRSWEAMSLDMAEMLCYWCCYRCYCCCDGRPIDLLMAVSQSMKTVVLMADEALTLYGLLLCVMLYNYIP